MSNQNNNQGGNNQVSYDKVKTQDSPIRNTKNISTTTTNTGTTPKK